MDKSEFALLYGQMQALIDMNQALLTTHPNPKAVAEDYEKFLKKTAERCAGFPPAFHKGWEGVTTQLRGALSVRLATDSLLAASPPGALS